MFRGREQSRPELGFRLLRRLEDEIQELGYVESSAKQDGRNMIMVIGPHRKKSESKAERTASREAAAAADEAPVPRPRRPSAPPHQARQPSASQSSASQPSASQPSASQQRVGQPDGSQPGAGAGSAEPGDRAGA
jgi:translation initiation factor IF-3